MEHVSVHTPFGAKINPGPELYAEVRAEFVRRGRSLAAWCQENSVHRQNATAALKGTWKGPGALRLVGKIMEEVRV